MRVYPSGIETNFDIKASASQHGEKLPLDFLLLANSDHMTNYASNRFLTRVSTIMLTIDCSNMKI